MQLQRMASGAARIRTWTAPKPCIHLPTTCGAIASRRSSENNFTNELQVERFAGPDAGGAVEVADGVADHPVRADRTCSGSKIDPVQHVVHFRTQLHAEALFDGEVLEDGQ